MQEKLQALLAQLQKHIRLVAFIVAALLLGAVYYLKISDPGMNLGSTDPDSDIGDPTRIATYVDPNAPPPGNTVLRQEIEKNKVPAQATIGSLTATNIFDVKSVLAAADGEKAISDKLKQIRAAINLRGVDSQVLFKARSDAHGWCQEILQQQPNHAEAQGYQLELKNLLGL